MLSSIRKRHEFLALRDKGLKKVTRPFILQAYDLHGQQAPRYGLTASKKIGNAVRRNRARRRMRALVRLHLTDAARPGYHYGLIARFDLPDMAFDRLEAEFVAALAAVHKRYDEIAAPRDHKEDA